MAGGSSLCCVLPSTTSLSPMTAMTFGTRPLTGRPVCKSTQQYAGRQLFVWCCCLSETESAFVGRENGQQRHLYNKKPAETAEQSFGSITDRFTLDLCLTNWLPWPEKCSAASRMGLTSSSSVRRTTGWSRRWLLRADTPLGDISHRCVQNPLVVEIAVGTSGCRDPCEVVDP